MNNAPKQSNIFNMHEADSMTDGVFEMLRAAVNTAKRFQTKSVKALKDRLNLAYPGRQADIDSAISFWAQEIRRTHRRGVTQI